MRSVPLWPKNRSRSSSDVLEAGQIQPLGQSRGNQKVGEWRVFDCPNHRRRLRVRGWCVRAEPAEGRVFADVPQGEGPLSLERRCRLPLQLVLWIVRVHAQSLSNLGLPSQLDLNLEDQLRDPSETFPKGETCAVLIRSFPDIRSIARKGSLTGHDGGP